jgi:hypothetical protein
MHPSLLFSQLLDDSAYSLTSRLEFGRSRAPGVPCHSADSGAVHNSGKMKSENPHCQIALYAPIWDCKLRTPSKMCIDYARIH